jgi:hypothetical protein
MEKAETRDLGTAGWGGGWICGRARPSDRAFWMGRCGTQLRVSSDDGDGWLGVEEGLGGLTDLLWGEVAVGFREEAVGVCGVVEKEV